MDSRCIGRICTHVRIDKCIVQWVLYNLAVHPADDLLRVGFFSFPQLGQITILREPVETFLTAAASTPPSSSPAIIQPQPLLTGRSKIFELSQICDLAKVCLIYETSDTNVPRIFVLVLATQRWYFLADAFAEYHRMAIAHLGLPSWELCFTPRPLPPWTEQLFRLLAPHLLERTEPRRTRHYWMPSATIGGEQLQQQPFNQLDAGIFRTAAKTTTATAKVTTSTTAAVVGGGGMRTQQRRGHY